MIATPDPAVAPFTTGDYAGRMERVIAEARTAGLDGVLVTPGPDLVWLTGYRPTAVNERLTMLFLTTHGEPTLLVPTLERPDAEAAAGTAATTLVDWQDGTDPYAERARSSCPDGTYGVSDNAWAMHLLGLQTQWPRSTYHSFTERLPMLRAVKDDKELARLEAAGAAADATYGEIIRCASPDAVRPTWRATWPNCCAASGTSRSTSPSSAPAPTARTRTTGPVTG